MMYDTKVSGIVDPALSSVDLMRRLKCAGSDVPYHGIGPQLFVLAFNFLNLEDKNVRR
jgi:hypothetical protein